MPVRLLSLLVSLLAVCGSLMAQAAEIQEESGINRANPDSALAFYQPAMLSALDSAVLVHELPLLALLDGHRLPLSTALGRMGTTPADLFPLAYLRPAVSKKAKITQTTSGKESPGDEEEQAMQSRQSYYAGGEMGAFYGRSTGKFGYEEYGSYIQGTVGNDKFQITAGASYQEATGRFPRFVR